MFSIERLWRVWLLVFIINSLARLGICADKEAWKGKAVFQIVTDRFNRGNGDVTTPCITDQICGGDFNGIIQQL